MRKEVKLEELKDFVENFLQQLPSRDSATVIGLYGNLGAGKTTLVKELAKQLGVSEDVTSPTFTLMKTYELDPGSLGSVNELKVRDDVPSFKKLIHIDLYRIENAEEIKIINLEELFEEKDSIILIEWIDRIENELKDDFMKIKIEYKDENSREIEIIYG